MCQECVSLDVLGNCWVLPFEGRRRQVVPSAVCLHAEGVMDPNVHRTTCMARTSLPSIPGLESDLRARKAYSATKVKLGHVRRYWMTPDWRIHALKMLKETMTASIITVLAIIFSTMMVVAGESEVRWSSWDRTWRMEPVCSL